jgi:hypothetical protein
MWNETTQQQLNELRQRELTGTLAHEERSTLDRLLNELEQDEWECLGPELRRLDAEQAELRESCSQLRTQNELLAVSSFPPLRAGRTRSSRPMPLRGTA